MTELPQKNGALNTKERSSDSLDTEEVSTSTDQEVNKTRSPRATWSSFFTTSFSIFDRSTCSSSCETKEVKSRNSGWMATLRKAITSGSMRRLQERVLGTGKIDISSSSSDVWLLGECYRVLPEESSGAENLDNGVIAFQEDFSSRIWMTYRKGFDVIADSKFSSDVNWGCMIRSSQMLVAQALVFHHLGRHWRQSMQPYDPKYIEILRLFGDSNDSAFSIHNLLLAGKSYGLASGSWVGPYAMCRSWEVLARGDREKQSLAMVVYVVSGDEDGERGGAPVVHIDVASRLCFEFQNAELSWAPLLLLVPLVLGLDKVNPRYIPLLWATFTFPQSLGILGGKPGASTYIVGVQDDKALYLDPHEVQPAVNIGREDLEADTSSYHCSTVRHLPLEQIDPSLAIGFYCKDKDDFDDFCARATELADSSNGAPLFTVAQSPQTPNKAYQSEAFSDSCCESGKDRTEGAFCVQNSSSSCNIQQQQEDDWQLL